MGSTMVYLVVTGVSHEGIASKDLHYYLLAVIIMYNNISADHTAML